MPALTETNAGKKNKGRSTNPYPKHEHSFQHTNEASELFQIVMSDSWQEVFNK